MRIVVLLAAGCLVVSAGVVIAGHNETPVNPTATTLGGIESYAAVTNQWINTISTSGVPSSTQPAFSNISGTATVAQTPAFHRAAASAVAMQVFGGI